MNNLSKAFNFFKSFDGNVKKKSVKYDKSMFCCSCGKKKIFRCALYNDIEYNYLCVSCGDNFIYASNGTKYIDSIIDEVGFEWGGNNE